MDLDSTRRKYAFQELIDDMDSGEIDILIGTQMVTKGLDFEGVTLVGILSAENVMSHLDYRSNERAFNMLSQVVGRSGRKTKGQVVIQTFDLEHPTLDWVMKQDYHTYYTTELQQRREFTYPPFVRLIRITLKHQNVGQVERGAMELFRFLNTHFKGRVLGPEFPPVPRIRNKYIQQLVIKLPKSKNLTIDKRIIKNRIDDFYSSSNNRSILVTVDVDPLN
jgi:primosomal protein N' (replication factor Y)